MSKVSDSAARATQNAPEHAGRLLSIHPDYYLAAPSGVTCLPKTLGLDRRLSFEQLGLAAELWTYGTPILPPVDELASLITKADRGLIADTLLDLLTLGYLVEASDR